MEDAKGTLFVSIPTLLDPSLAPEGCHIFHAFTPEWVDDWKVRKNKRFPHSNDSQNLDRTTYSNRKDEVFDAIVERLDKVFPGLKEGIVFKCFSLIVFRCGFVLREIGTPRTHQRFIGRADGTYGPIPSKRPSGMMSMPFNRTSIDGLYCVGDSTFPGQVWIRSDRCSILNTGRQRGCIFGIWLCASSFV